MKRYLRVLAAATALAVGGASMPACSAATTSGPEAVSARQSGEAEVARASFQQNGPWILLENVSVNGEGPFRFLLDTGASGDGRVDASLVERLVLRTKETMESRGPSGASVSMPLYTVASVEIAGAKFKNLKMAGRDYNNEMGFAAAGMPIDGILGMAMFRDYLLSIDYAAHEVVISKGALPPANGHTVFDNTADDDGIVAPVMIGGQTFEARLDSGSPGAITVGGGQADKLKWKSEPVVVGRGRSADGEFEIQRATLDGSVEIGDLTVDTPDVDIVRSFRDVNVGARMLSHFVVTIDQKNGRVGLIRSRADDPAAETAAAEPGGPTRRVVVAAPSSTKRYGIAMAPPAVGAETLDILDVIPGAVAEGAGLKRGDKITKINGHAVSSLQPAEIGAALRASPLALEIEQDGRKMNVEMTLE